MTATSTTPQDSALAAAEQLVAELRTRSVDAFALRTPRGAVVIAPMCDLTIAIHHADRWQIGTEVHRSFRVTVNACLVLRHALTTDLTHQGPRFDATPTLRALGALQLAECLI